MSRVACVTDIVSFHNAAPNAKRHRDYEYHSRRRQHIKGPQEITQTLDALAFLHLDILQLAFGFHFFQLKVFFLLGEGAAYNLLLFFVSGVNKRSKLVF